MQPQVQQSNRVYTGLFLLVAGIIVLAHKMGMPIPRWFFSNGMLLIGIGFLVGLKSKFKNIAAFILFAIGGIFLADEFFPQMQIEKFATPIALIGVGVYFIFKPKHAAYSKIKAEKLNTWGNIHNAYGTNTTTAEVNNATSFGTTENVEHINAVVAFSGLKKNIVAKNFKGGELTCFMGGAEINLSQADIQGNIILDVTNIFGGTKLVVPSNWIIQNEVTAVFGAVEDRRPLNTNLLDTNKTMILKGTCLFGGVDIKTY